MTQKASEVPQNSGVPTPEFRDLSQTSDTGPRTLGPVGMPVLIKVCYVLMVLEPFVRSSTLLVPDNLDLTTSTELSQYSITKWILVFANGKIKLPVIIIIPLKIETNENDGVKMEITFKRRLTNEIMTTFIPSAFLILISYSTLYFKQFYFEAVVTINLTTLLVATNLFIR